MPKEPDLHRILAIQEKIAKGQVDRDKVALAAYLGDVDSLHVLDDTVETLQDLRKWSDRLRITWGQHVCQRATVAWARAALLRWDKPKLPDKLFRLKYLPYELVMLAEDWALNPRDQLLPSASDALETSKEEPMLLADQDGLLTHATILSAAICSVGCFAEPKWETMFADARQDAEILWPKNPDRVKQIVAKELIPWALQEGDPLVITPTHKPG